MLFLLLSRKHSLDYKTESISLSLLQNMLFKKHVCLWKRLLNQWDIFISNEYPILVIDISRLRSNFFWITNKIWWSMVRIVEKLTCLLGGNMPRIGKIQAHDAGKISVSAKQIHCKIWAWSNSVFPRNCAFDT